MNAETKNQIRELLKKYNVLALPGEKLKLGDVLK